MRTCVIIVASLFVPSTVSAAGRSMSNWSLPITESVSMGPGDGVYQVDFRDLPFGKCMPITDTIKDGIKVCGANTRVKVYLRGRCADYYAYAEDVGH